MKKFYLKYIQEVHVCSLKKRTYLKRAQSGKNLELTAFVCLDWMCTRTWTSPCVSITSTPHTTPTSAASSSGASPTWRCTGKLSPSCHTSCHSCYEQHGDVQADTARWLPVRGAGLLGRGRQGKEMYKGEIKADRDKTKPYIVQYLRTHLGQLMQYQLSLSNEMRDQLLP